MLIPVHVFFFFLISTFEGLSLKLVNARIHNIETLLYTLLKDSHTYMRLYTQIDEN